jgi:hypothetical protein
MPRLNFKVANSRFTGVGFINNFFPVVYENMGIKGKKGRPWFSKFPPIPLFILPAQPGQEGLARFSSVEPVGSPPLSDSFKSSPKPNGHLQSSWHQAKVNGRSRICYRFRGNVGPKAASGHSIFSFPVYGLDHVVDAVWQVPAKFPFVACDYSGRYHFLETFH